ncbi:MAG: FMN-binding protein [Omnitrophica bacterium]|nr:FMN-binding protein [Candidatus Omnitrophota bacterium]
MRNTLKMISVLTTVGLISGAVLVFMYEYANPLILSNQEREIKEDAVFKIFPRGKSAEEKIIEGEVTFEVRDASGRFLGYAFLAEGNGYQGLIKMIAGIKPDLKTIAGIKILESQETPGLGGEITGDKFKMQFKGLKTEPGITYVKNKPATKPGEIQAITGATVSSAAVVSILNKRISSIRKAISKQ